MTTQIARYSVSYGLTGCYMPDITGGPYIFTTRRALANFIRDELATYEMPKSLFREVKINNLWSHITRHGSSAAHFYLRHGGNTLGFHGLTEAEAAEMEAENDL